MPSPESPANRTTTDSSSLREAAPDCRAAAILASEVKSRLPKNARSANETLGPPRTGLPPRPVLYDICATGQAPSRRPRTNLRPYRRRGRGRLQKVEAHMLARDEATVPGRAGFGFQPFHEQVLVIGIVMEDRKCFLRWPPCTGVPPLARLNAPSRSWPETPCRCTSNLRSPDPRPRSGSVFLVGPADDVLGIGDVDCGLALEFDAIGGRPVGVVQQHRLDLDSLAEREVVAGLSTAERICTGAAA